MIVHDNQVYWRLQALDDVIDIYLIRNTNFFVFLRFTQHLLLDKSSGFHAIEVTRRCVTYGTQITTNVLRKEGVKRKMNFFIEGIPK